MITFPGFELEEKLYTGAYSVVYRARRESDDNRVIIKLLREQYPSKALLARFKYEYRLLASFEGLGTVISYGLEPYENSLAIVMEDFGTYSLKQLLVKRSLSLKGFLKLALGIVDALEIVHAHDIVHKDINPANILVDEKNGSVKIIDFGISSTLSREVTELDNFELLEGMLPYISPEQTGRMNRGVDYRTDYYSLGVVFYEMLTGKLPFETEDPMELVHCHIAKVPLLPHEIKNTIPPVLSAIVMKLMSKTVEERYQSLFGLKEDLKKCMDQMEKIGKIESFEIASKNISSRFVISEKLYGRENEINSLMNAFDRSRASQAELVLVAGHSGVGKSRLINELYKPITINNGYFVFGKFNQYERNRPYSSIIQLLQNFIKKILSESEEQIAVWRERIQSSVGMNGQVIADVIPEIVTIIGEQPPLPVVELEATKNRFRYVFQNFIQCLAAPEHPIVMFLDDLQWADTPSLEFMEALLVDPHSHSFLIIGAYRDNEVDRTHMLMEVINTLKKASIPITEISLNPLKIADIENLLADSLHGDLASIKSLAELCNEKTLGNPFFLIQFLEGLYKEGMIAFDTKIGGWGWSIDKIRQKGYTDNVVDFMLKKVQELSGSSQSVLKLASCLGSSFDINALTSISQQPQKQVAEALSEPLKKGLIVPLDDAYRYFEDESAENIHYKFVHDRVQQAAYSLFEKDELPSIHLDIGRKLLKSTPKERVDEMVLEIIGHFNLGISLIVDPAEKEQISKLNLMAGKKAKLSVAYKSAIEYLTVGISLLPVDSWNSTYDLTLNLHRECLEAAGSSGDHELMNKHYDIIVNNGRNILDKMPAYTLKISELCEKNELKECIDLAIEVLKSLNVNIAAKPTQLQIIMNYIKCRYLLHGKSMDELYNLPPMTDPYAKVAIRMIWNLGQMLFCYDKNILSMALLTIVQLSVKFGFDSMSPVMFAVYGWFLLTMNNKKGFEYADLGLRQADRPDMDPTLRICFFSTFNILVQTRREHSAKTAINLKALIQPALDLGEIAAVSNASIGYSLIALHSGADLAEVTKNCEYCAQITAAKSQTQHNHFITSQWMAALILAGHTEEETFSKTHYEHEKMTKYYLESKNYLVYLCSMAALLIREYILDKKDDAWKHACDVFPHIQDMPGMFYGVYLYYYCALIFLSHYPELTKPEQKLVLKRVKLCLREIKPYTGYAPMNYLHKYYLISAELARVKGDNRLAKTYYEKAIELAKENNYTNDEAVANEAAAKYFMGLGRKKFAKIYMSEASYCYSRWGAFAKAKLLEEKYPQYFVKESTSDGLTTSLHQTTTHQTSTSSGNVLDVMTIMKSTRAISKEIKLDTLLSTMLHIVIENAGAQNGALLLEKQGSWYIEAQGTAEKEYNLLSSIPIEGTLPASIVNYVIRTKEAVVIGDATADNQYSNDPYIIEKKPRSLLCLPLLNQGSLSAILYLENNLIANSFHENRLHLLSLLSGQMVISIDNARVYSAYDRFVPKQFLTLLERKSVVDVMIGDHVQKDMTVMFLDIRNFTTLSEKMSPQETFSLINEFLSYMEPVIRKHNGFIDKYLGDGFMALFPTCADDALHAGIDMLKALKKFNTKRTKAGNNPINFGVGLNSGVLMLGTVGGAHRMDGTVVSDTVNVASRVESLTKVYKCQIIITAETYSRLINAKEYDCKEIGEVLVAGKVKPVAIYSVAELATEKNEVSDFSPDHRVS